MSLIDLINDTEHKWIVGILDNGDVPWVWRGISHNPKITRRIVEELPHKQWHPFLRRNGTYTSSVQDSSHWFDFSFNPHLTWDLICENPYADWCWSGISHNPNITWDIIQNHLNKPWDWWGVSKNKNVTWDIVQEHPQITWNWFALSQNPNITWDIVQAHPNKPWDWIGLSANPNINWKIVQENPEKPWDWAGLSRIIEWDIIQAHPDKPWKWWGLSMNRTITWDIVREHLPMWEWSVLCYNPQLFELPDIEKQRVARRYFATRTIQKRFLKSYYCPRFKICRNRLLRECKTLTSEI